MHPYPHSYVASASAAATGFVSVGSPQLPNLESAPPPQFGGPNGVWSPETFLCAALADCFILTFRGVSRAAQFDWLRLQCRVESVFSVGSRACSSGLAKSHSSRVTRPSRR